MTTIFDAVPLEAIDQAASEVDFGRGARRLVAALFYYPARFVGSLVSGLGWCVAAWKVGYGDGRGLGRHVPAPPRMAQDRTTR